MRTLTVTTGCSMLLSWSSGIAAELLLNDRFAVLGSFAGFQLSHNPGIAFGLRLPPVVQELLIGIALVVVGVIAVLSARRPISRSPDLPIIAFGLILGGGIANIIDRIPDGLVTDFIQIGSFPTFNVADSCITIGAVLLLLESFRGHGRKV